jgi:toxin YoeB
LRKSARSLIFDHSAFEDLVWWVGNDRKKALRIMRLIDEACNDLFHGLGKPEPLKHELSGLWSRRIDDGHRIIYQVFDDSVRILSCRHHY